jgi:HK97 family phage portal protein
MIAEGRSEDWEVRDLFGFQTETGPLPPIRWVDGDPFAGQPPEAALTVTAIFACVRFLSETVASMPMHLYQATPDGGRRRDKSHPLYRTLCVQPNPYQSYFEWMEQKVYHTALYGNAFDLVVPGERGFATQLRPIHPSRVNVDRTTDGSVRYRVWQTNGSESVYSAEQIYHLRGLSDNGLVGLVPAQLCSASVRLAQQLDQAAMSYWENNARPNVLLETSQPIPESAMEKLRSTWRRVFGGTKNTGQAAVLPNGVTAKIIDAASREGSQYMELRNAIVTEVARAFRIGPTMIGQLDHGTYSNVEQESLNAQKFTLTPWQRRIEGAIRRQLLSTYGDEWYVQIDSRGLLRGDSQARASYFNTLFQLGALSPNDIRRIEDYDAIEDTNADEYFVQLNMSPLSKAAGVPAVGDSGPALEAGQAAAAAEPLNGAQISSLLEVLANVSGGLLTKDGARAIIAAAFPTLTAQQIDGIVAGVIAGVAVAPTQALPQQDEPAANKGESDGT